VIHATKKFKATDELFWDYNCDCFCTICQKWEHLFSMGESRTKCGLKGKQYKHSKKWCWDCMIALFGNEENLEIGENILLANWSHWNPKY